MKTSSSRFSMFKFVSKRSLKLDSVSYSYVSRFIKYFNIRLNNSAQYSNPFPCYYVFSMRFPVHSSITEYIVQPKLFENQYPHVVVNSINSFVYFVKNYRDIRCNRYGDLVVKFDLRLLINDILSNQF